MKRKLFLSVFCLSVLALASCSTTRKGTTHKLPPLKEISPIHDSIIEEGYALYYSERANWVATDLVFEKYRPDELGSSVSYQPDKSSWMVVFFDQKNENSVMECRFEIGSGQTIVVDSIRPISDVENEMFQRKQMILREAVNKYGAELSFAPESFGDPNVDIICYSDKLTRLYFLQGTILHDLIPFGNDYSIDFDESLKPIAFRRYHSSLIQCPTKDEKGNVAQMTWHSHLKDNPYITPTDICNFLLYRPENMIQFTVYSTAYSCWFTFDVKQRRIYSFSKPM